MVRTILAAAAVVFFATPAIHAQQAPSAPAVVAALEEAFTQAVERAEGSVVSIMRINLDQNSSLAAVGRDPLFIGRVGLGNLDPSDPDFVPNEMGSGVIVDAKGLVLTNYHVVRSTATDSQDQSLLYVTLPNGTGHYASIWAADPTSDLAVLRLDLDDASRTAGLTPISVGDASTLKKGQFVLALGNPYNIAHDGSASVSWGIVSNIARKHWNVAIDAETGQERRDLHKYGTLIQTDARLNLGTSGGALVNLRGEMVGLTTSLAAIAGYEQSAGYAIPMNDSVKRIVETLKEGREVEYGFLGIGLGDPRFLPRGPTNDSLGGVVVGDVYVGTPAARAGLQVGDVIVSLGGQPVRDRDDLMLAAATRVLGKETQLVVSRNGRRIELSVRLTKFPVQPGVTASVRSEPWRGLRVDHPTADEDVFRDSSLSGVLQQGCVLVTSVEPGSPAAAAGLAVGNLITHVDGKPVETPDRFQQAVRGQTGPVEIRLARVSPNDTSVVTVLPN